MRKGIPVRSRYQPLTYAARAARKLIDVREDERRRIAHELHDAFGQDLVAVLLEMNRVALSCKARDEQNTFRDEVCSELQTLSTRVGEIASSISDVSHKLHPIILERAGLHQAIGDLCKDIGSSTSLRVSFSNGELRESISAPVSLCLYRIAQEALRNIVKHAHASSAEVTLKRQEHGLVLTVRDDGVGYNPRKLGSAAGLGVTDMREHATSLGGSFAVNSVLGKGTKITVQLPFQAMG
jgi:two-component system, NarL family, sensor kinase